MRKAKSSKLKAQSSQNGVVALVTVIVMGAMLMSIGIAVAFLGQTQLVITAGEGKQREAMALAMTCLEEATHRLKLASSYAGGTVPVGTQTCTVTVAGSGSTRTVTSSATVDIYTKGAVATLTLKQNAALNSNAWEVTAWAESDPP